MKLNNPPIQNQRNRSAHTIKILLVVFIEPHWLIAADQGATARFLDFNNLLTDVADVYSAFFCHSINSSNIE
jgi:hypothetical protein